MPIPRDVRFALRTLRGGRLVGLFGIASLALAIAGNSVVYSLVHAFVIRPLPYPEADRLVLLGEREKDRPALAFTALTSALPTMEDYRDRSTTLREWGAFSPTYMSISGTDRSIPVTAAHVTPGFFRVLRAEVAKGRLLLEEEMVPHGPPVALVSYEYWQRSMPPERDPVGSVLIVDGEPREVVGVLEEGFEFIVPRVDLWLPMQSDAAAVSRNARTVISVARMAPDATMAQVEAEVRRIAAAVEREHPDTHGGWTAHAINLRTGFPDPQTTTYLGILQGAVLCALLMVCANVVSLILAGYRGRWAEIGVRVALGAGRVRLAREMAREALVIPLVGGALGLGLATLAIPLLARPLAGVLSPAFLPRLETAVVLACLAFTTLCALLLGVLPALEALQAGPAQVLRGVGSGGAGRRTGLNNALVVAEIALCLVTLGAGSVLIRSFLEARGAGPGFDQRGLLTVRFVAPAWKYGSRAETVDFLARIQERATALPVVRAAALVNPPPGDLFPPSDTFRLEGGPVEAGDRPPRAILVRASPRYLETLGVPVLEGRFFDEADHDGNASVAVVNRTLAEARFPDRSPLGERLTVGGRTREIGGVAGDIRQGVAAPPNGRFEETIYLPLFQEPGHHAYLVVRARGEPLALSTPLLEELRLLDPDLTVNRVETMEEFSGKYMAGLDMANRILAAFGGFALLLAALGTYGLVAHSAAQRRHEIGVRFAIGASPARVVAMLAGQGLRLAALGLALGGAILVPVLAVVGRVVVGMGLSPIRPTALVSAGGMLLLVTLVATVVPAQRAAGVDPMSVLNVE